MAKARQHPDSKPERTALKKLYAALRPGLEEQLLKVHSKLRGVLEEGGFTPTIKYRVKGFDNYFNKLLKLLTEQQRPLLISDLLGLRVICPFLEDLDTVERLIAANFAVVELERKGERHSFREFGYDSVHLLIQLEPDQEPPFPLPGTAWLCEIQLRTILQDAWAEVEHELVYKSDIALPNDSIRRKLASLNASLSLSDLIFQEIRDYQKEVRARGLKRRQSVEEILAATSSIDLADHAEEPDGKPYLELLDPTDGSPRGLEKLMYQALEAHSNKNFKDAVQLYARILRMKIDPPLRSLVYNHRGMALFALAEYLRAIEDFSRALHYNNANGRAWCNRGLVYRIQGNYDQSLLDYEQAIQLAPEQPDGFWGRAQTCYEMQLYSRALADCQKVLALQADFTPAADLEKTLRRQMF